MERHRTEFCRRKDESSTWVWAMIGGEYRSMQTADWLYSGSRYCTSNKRDPFIVECDECLCIDNQFDFNKNWFIDIWVFCSHMCYRRVRQHPTPAARTLFSGCFKPFDKVKNCHLSGKLEVPEMTVGVHRFSDRQFCSVTYMYIILHYIVLYIYCISHWFRRAVPGLRWINAVYLIYYPRFVWITSFIFFIKYSSASRFNGVGITDLFFM